MVHGDTTVVFPPLVVGGQTQSDMQMSSTLCRDISTMGWGATLDAGDGVSGTWTPQEAEEIINFLEMMVIYLAMSHFSSRLRGQTILK